MDEIKKGFFHNIYYSIAGYKYYKYFPGERLSKAFLYLLLLSLVVGIIGMSVPLVILNGSINQMILRYDSDVPEFTFSNGELTVEGQMPIIIDGGYTTVIIDTTVSDENSILNNYDRAILVTKDKLIQKTYEKKQVTNFSMLSGFSTNKDEVREMLPMLKWLVAIFAFLLLIWFIIEKFIGALIYGALGWALSRAMRLNLVFRDCLVLAIHAMTLPMIVFGILEILPLTIPFLWFLFYVVTNIYLYGGLSEIRKNQLSI